MLHFSALEKVNWVLSFVVLPCLAASCDSDVNEEMPSDR